MLLGARPHPRAEHWTRGGSSGGFDETVGGFPKGPVGPKGDRLEANAELFFFDDRMSPAVLRGSVRIGTSSTNLVVEHSTNKYQISTSTTL